MDKRDKLEKIIKESDLVKIALRSVNEVECEDLINSLKNDIVDLLKIPDYKSCLFCIHVALRHYQKPCNTCGDKKLNFVKEPNP